MFNTIETMVTIAGYSGFSFALNNGTKNPVVDTIIIKDKTRIGKTAGRYSVPYATLTYATLHYAFF